MQAVDWRDLQTFLALARTRHMARAGVTMGVNATTIARRLRRLETALGTTLFEQARDGQVLTEAGEALFARVEAIALTAGEIEPQRTGRTAALSGTLRISVPEGLGSNLLTRHVGTLAAAHPDVTLDIVASSGFLSPSKREADIAVMLSRPRAGPVIARKLTDYALQLFATKGYLAAFGMPHQPSDLREGHRFTSYIPDLIYAPELNYLDEFGPGLVPHLRSSSINAQYRIVRSGVAIGVLPAFIGGSDPALVPVLPQRRILRTFWQVTHKDSHQRALVRAGREWLSHIVEAERALLLPKAG
ncbi:LysR family transcriptional regulator [Sphingomonas sp. 22176]|uniref:LysR family transcriptional regulator n=1 Tax=Sphingomonas sp. 22176 TaxID=3453884 RepID=UPI003F868B5B